MDVTNKFPLLTAILQAMWSTGFGQSKSTTSPKEDHGFQKSRIIQEITS